MHVQAAARVMVSIPLIYMLVFGGIKFRSPEGAQLNYKVTIDFKSMQHHLQVGSLCRKQFLKDNC